MMERMGSSVRLPSPALVIAVLALAFAMGGGVLALANSGGNKVIKKIAQREIKRLAPGLSVAHAESAGTAANAQALGGSPASAFLPSGAVRADAAATSADLDVTSASFTNILSKTFTATSDGFVFAVATLTARQKSSPAVGILEYNLAADGNALTTDAGYHSVVTTDNTFLASGAVSAVIPVSAGQHTIAIQAREQGGGTVIRGRDLSLLFTPNGSAPVIPY
jgi:hypothetical protein